MNKVIWYRTTSKLPQDGESVLVSARGYNTPMMACYFAEIGKWLTNIDNTEVEIDVKFWTSLPVLPTEPCPFVFRTADEARYFADCSNDARVEDPELEIFIKVRTAILNASTSGKYELTVPVAWMTDNIREGLSNAGFNWCKDENGGYLISWLKGGHIEM